MINSKELLEIYPSFKEQGFDDKWLNYNDLIRYFNNKKIEKQQIGSSFLGLPIYKLTIGNGEKRILIWSQMHGNESTGTRAMFDVLNFLKLNNLTSTNLLENLTIDFIPMLNPDGANLYTRRNAAGIDINRDFLAKQSKEIHVLLKQVEEGNYSVLFNLHDQRTIFNVGNTNEPATLSFLAPSYNVEEDVNDVRQKTMGIIQSINNVMQEVIPGKIGRYTSEFYPMSTGDNFTKMGYPCVLFEAGHFPEDYSRNETRKFNALAIISGLYAISTNKDLPFDKYEQIPKNNQKFLDVVVRNVSVISNNNKSLVDLGIYFDSIYNETINKVETVAKITEIGDLNKLIGHKEFDALEKTFKSLNKEYPILNQIATFKLDELNFVNGKLIN